MKKELVLFIVCFILLRARRRTFSISSLCLIKEEDSIETLNNCSVTELSPGSCLFLEFVGDFSNGRTVRVVVP